VSIRKRGTSFQVRLPGERARSFPTRKAAERFQLERKLARAERRSGSTGPVQAETLHEAAAGYVQRWRALKNPAAATLERAQENLKPWRDEFGERLLEALTLVEIEDAIVEVAGEHRNKAKKSLEWLKRVLRDAQRRGQRFDPALLQIEPIRSVSRSGIALDVDLLQRLGSWFPEQIALLPEIVGSVGLRIGEALSLEDDRVDVHRGELFIPAHLCKERREKTIKLAGFERELIAEQLLARPPGTRIVFPRAGGKRYAPGGMWSKPDFYKRVWHPARQAAAREWRSDHGQPEWSETPFERIVPHDLRHSAISLMAAGGMTPEVIAERVGHSDGGRLILERYRHLFPDELPAQLERYEAARKERLRLVADA
jgi:integrase